MTSDPIVAELPGNRRDAMNLMVKNKLTGVPVVKDDKLKGFISRHDFFEQPYEDQLAILYNKDHPSIYDDDPLDVPAEIFVENDIYYLPVKDKEHRCVGILTTAASAALRSAETRGRPRPDRSVP
ncbi:MAG: CBS domain-containing protein [Thermoplasmata archaeon]